MYACNCYHTNGQKYVWISNKKKERRKKTKKIEYTDRSIQKILNQWDVFKIDVKLTVK